MTAAVCLTCLATPLVVIGGSQFATGCKTPDRVVVWETQAPNNIQGGRHGGILAE